jgi:hypothetical protein
VHYHCAKPAGCHDPCPRQHLADRLSDVNSDAKSRSGVARSTDKKLERRMNSAPGFSNYIILSGAPPDRTDRDAATCAPVAWSPVVTVPPILRRRIVVATRRIAMPALMVELPVFLVVLVVHYLQSCGRRCDTVWRGNGHRRRCREGKAPAKHGNKYDGFGMHYISSVRSNTSSTFLNA